VNLVKALYQTKTALNRHKEKQHPVTQAMNVMTRSKFQDLKCAINKLVESTEANLQELKKIKMEFFENCKPVRLKK
jgi:hypothetical protein